MSWYYDRNGEREGPIAEADMAELVRGGIIGRETPVWRDGLADWEPAWRHFPETRAAGAAAVSEATSTGGPPAARNYRREVGMAEAFRLFFQNYFNFSKRSNRGEFWFFVLDSIIIAIVLGLLDGIVFGFDEGAGQPLSFLWSLAIFIPSIALGVRRLHDTGRSGWWYLLILVPVVGALVLLWWFTRPPEDHPNQWG